MERTVTRFATFDEADRAERELHQRMTPEERLTILLELIERERAQYGEAAERFERVSRVTRLERG